MDAGALRSPRDSAAVILINSCTVTSEADAKTRKAIRQALAAAQTPWVIVTGCAAALDQASSLKLGDRVLVVPDRLQALASAKQLLAIPENIKHDPSEVKRLRSGADFPTRMGLKIQDGCDNRCSFCIVNQARGPSHSQPAEDLVNQIQAAEQAGIKEIVLTGVNIGLYQSQGLHLPGLLKLILAATTMPRFRLSSLEPQHASDELLDLISAAGGRICAHLHLPLQSGSDAILKKMDRLYDTELFYRQAQKARELLPHLGLTTDIICGFPSESDRDHAQSLEFCRQLSFAKIHVFRYSARPKTPAAQRSDKLAAEVIAHRAQEMRALAQNLADADARRRVGGSEEVLVESPGWGRSESYLRVHVPRSLAIGSLQPMRFNSYDGTLIAAEPCVR
jgi:threonylcarbamoyladenosine tRNA methylthiotransferase MtaB